MEQLWPLTLEDLNRKARGYPARVYTSARDGTLALTKAIAKVEKEIDKRVATLYGLE